MTTDNLSTVNSFSKIAKSTGTPATGKEIPNGQKSDSLEILANAKKFSSHLDSSIEKADISRRSDRAEQRRTDGQERSNEARSHGETKRAERAHNTDTDRSEKTKSHSEIDETARNQAENAPEHRDTEAKASDTRESSEQQAKRDDDHSTNEQDSATTNDDTSEEPIKLTEDTESAADTETIAETAEEAEAQTETTEAVATPLLALNTAATPLNQTQDGEKAAAAALTTGAIEDAAKNTANKTGTQLDALANSNGADASETDDGLESTLGTDEASKSKKSSKQTGSELNELVKAMKDTATNKESANNLAGQIQQNQNATPLLAANPNGKAGLSQAAFGLNGQDTAAIQSADSAEGLTAATNSVDGKASPATNQLRAAGYTSPTQSLAIQIAQKAQNGTQQFEIRMNPPELGRVDVRLEFGKDSQVATHLIVERPETLDMLTRDSRQLEKALEQAGLNLEGDGLTFSLQDQGEAGNQQAKSAFDAEGNAIGSLDKEAEPDAANIIYRRVAPPNGIDISI